MPVIMITARRDEAHRVTGPRAGRRRLRGQALLAGGGGRAGARGHAARVGAPPDPHRVLRAGPGRDRAHRPPGDGGRARGGPHAPGVRPPGRAGRPPAGGLHPGAPAGEGLGLPVGRRRQDGGRPRGQPAPQARRGHRDRRGARGRLQAGAGWREDRRPAGHAAAAQHPGARSPWPSRVALVVVFVLGAAHARHLRQLPLARGGGGDAAGSRPTRSRGRSSGPARPTSTASPGRPTTSSATRAWSSARPARSSTGTCRSRTWRPRATARRGDVTVLLERPRPRRPALFGDWGAYAITALGPGGHRRPDLAALGDVARRAAPVGGEPGRQRRGRRAGASRRARGADRRRARAAGAGLQPHDGPAGGGRRPPAGVPGRHRPRAAHPGHGDRGLRHRAGRRHGGEPRGPRASRWSSSARRPPACASWCATSRS